MGKRFTGEPACSALTGSRFNQGWCLQAFVLCARATGSEPAACWWSKQVRWKTTNRRQLLFDILAERGNRFEQAHRIGMLWLSKEFCRLAGFNDLAGVHDYDPLAD